MKNGVACNERTGKELCFTVRKNDTTLNFAEENYSIMEENISDKIDEEESQQSEDEKRKNIFQQ